MRNQKTINAKDLSDEEQEFFTEYFYDIEEFDLLPEDFETSAPWGCPWDDIGDTYLKGSTIKEMVENYYESIFEELEKAMAIQKEVEQELEEENQNVYYN